MAAAVTTIIVAGTTITVRRKPIRHMYIRLAPDGGHVVVSAPWSWSDGQIAQAVASRSGWIERQRQRSAAHVPRGAGELDGQPISIWGIPHRMRVLPPRSRAIVVQAPGELVLHVGHAATWQRASAALAAWRQATVRTAAHPLLAHWCQRTGLSVRQLTIRHMTTLWGSCRIDAQRVCLNARLVHDPIDCLEYVIVHELAHLVERSHGARFDALVGHWLPDWQARHAQLGRGATG
jgi:predicted metal-dependent hydrolase